MRKNLILIVALLTCFVASWADNERKISFKELPDEAKVFLKGNFGGEKILWAHEEYEYTHDKKHYEVHLSDGTEIEFDKMGVWKEIDCKFKPLPKNIIPKKIQKFLSETYPDTKSVKIERDLYGYEVKLSNGRELVFDDNGDFIRFDE